MNEDDRVEVVGTKRYLQIMRIRSKNYDPIRRENLLYFPKMGRDYDSYKKEAIKKGQISGLENSRIPKGLYIRNKNNDDQWKDNGFCFVGA